MSKFVTLHGFGTGCENSGDAELNFAVVGGVEEPINPTENMIWINTDVEITSWMFDIKKPETSANDGMVFILIGIDDTTGFNVIKENNIQIYPVSAMQYIDGEWQSKDIKIYQNNQWKNFWTGVIYDAGDEYVKYTGGIDLYKGITGTYRDPTASATKNATNIRLTATRGGVSGGSGYAFMYTKNKIDLTPYKTISYVLSSVSQDAAICVLSSPPTNDSGSNVVAKSVTSAGTHLLDISNVNEGHICVRVHGWPGSDTGSNKAVTINKIALLK